MGATAINLKQLFSTEEKCLPNGRQALKFDCDFTLQNKYVVGGQQLNSIRQFAGIKGIYIQTQSISDGNGLNYQISNITEKSLSISPFFVQNPVTGTKYYVSTEAPSGAIVQYDSGTTVAYPAPPAGYSIVDFVGDSGFGTEIPCRIGPDGMLLLPIFNSSVTTNGLGLMKVNPQTGALISTVYITPCNGTLVAPGLSMVIRSDGTAFYSWTQQNTPTAGTNQNFIAGLDTVTMTYLGLFSGATGTQSFGNIQAPSLALDTNGNVVGFWSTSAYGLTMAVFPITGLSGGVYSGSLNPTVSLENLYLNNGMGMIGNQNGGVDFFIRVNTGVYVYRLDAPSFNFPATPANQVTLISTPTNIANFPLLEISNYPEKGFQFFYTWSYTTNTDGTITIFTLNQYDAYTLEKTASFLCPFDTLLQTNPGNIYSVFLQFNADTGDFYLSGGLDAGEIVEYAILGPSVLYITVNGTGQKIAIQLAPEMSVWIPLFALENDNVTLSSTANKITAMLTNFDLFPFILSQVQTIPSGSGISINGVSI